jgi:hypothetical protein
LVLVLVLIKKTKRARIRRAGKSSFFFIYCFRRFRPGGIE